MSGSQPGDCGAVDPVSYAIFIASVIAEDITRVHVRITAGLALAAVFVTQLPLDELQALPEGFRITTVVGIVLLVLSAACLFYYTQRLNMTRIKLATRVLDSEVREIASEWTVGFGAGKSRWIMLYMVGQSLQVFGAIALSVVTARLLLHT